MKKVLDTINHRDGMTVPPGYFEDFASRMAESLPVQPWEEGAPNILPKRTVWQAIRPYVYLVAMFLGVWCMMKMFDFIHPSSLSSFSNNPVVTAALGNDAFYNDYMLNESEISDEDLMDDLYETGFTPSAKSVAAIEI